jgi:putative membrane protein
VTEPGPRPGAVPPAADDGWRRLHPLSPLLRGGLVVLAVALYVGKELADRVLGSFAPERFGEPDGVVDAFVDDLADRPLVAVAAAGLLVVPLILILGAVTWVNWRFTRFRVTASQIELRSGVLFRQHRQVPLERIQAVELSRPVLARLLGLVRVVVQSAGGADSGLTLAYLAERRADAVRDHLLDLAGHSDEAGSSVPPGDHVVDGDPVVSVPNGRLFVATVLHGSTIALGILAVGAVLAAGVARIGLLALGLVPALIPVAFGVAVGRVKELLVHGNFTVTATSTGLRVRHGLTDLRAATVPLHRIQAVEVVQPLWWRRFGWWRIRVNVAGGAGAQDESAGQTTLLPVGTLDDALAVLAHLGVRAEDPTVDQALHGEVHVPGDGWVPVSPRARRLDPWSWRRCGYTLTPQAVILRTGRFTRRAVLVPHARVQSVTLSQGPLEARLGVASAQIVSTPGPVAAELSHLDLADAERFLARVTNRATAAPRRPAGRSVMRVASPAPDRPPWVDEGEQPLPDHVDQQTRWMS